MKSNSNLKIKSKTFMNFSCINTIIAIELARFMNSYAKIKVFRSEVLAFKLETFGFPLTCETFGCVEYKNQKHRA